MSTLQAQPTRCACGGGLERITSAAGAQLGQQCRRCYGSTPVLVPAVAEKKTRKGAAKEAAPKKPRKTRQKEAAL